MTDELLKEKGEISSIENLREQDVLLATGEQITIAKLSMCLSDLGYKAISLLGWQVPIITDSNYGDANVIDIKTDRILKELKDENIDILINNAGFGDAGNFTETSLDKEMDMIDLNIKAYHILTKLFLKDFVKRDYGRILNVASMAGFMPGPYMATYYATKNYIVSLSLAIYEELKRDKSNVKISIFCPGPVNTNFNNVADVKFNISSLNSEYASKVAIDGMFMNKLLIIPNNMKFNHLLTKIVPTKSILFVNSLIQERKEE